MSTPSSTSCANLLTLFWPYLAWSSNCQNRTAGSLLACPRCIITAMCVSNMIMVYRYNVEKSVALGKPGVPEWPMVIQDMVVDTPIAGDPAGVCRLKYDRAPGGGSTLACPDNCAADAHVPVSMSLVRPVTIPGIRCHRSSILMRWSTGVHHNQLWGDINLINGQPWPYLNVTASWQRFRILNASPSRPRILMVQPSFTPCHAAYLHRLLLSICCCFVAVKPSLLLSNHAFTPCHAAYLHRLLLSKACCFSATHHLLTPALVICCRSAMKTALRSAARSATSSALTAAPCPSRVTTRCRPPA